MVSELLYAGKSLSEVAGYDNTQLLRVIGRRRDRQGRLVGEDEELPEGVEVDENGMRVVTEPTSYEAMYREVELSRGRTEGDVESSWQRFLGENPKFGRGGED